MRRTTHFLSLLSVVLGLTLFVYLIARTGMTSILEKLQLLGWGFIVLILLSGARQAIRAFAWQRSVEPWTHRPSLYQLLGLRLVGEAFTDITPAGPLLGEYVKVWAGSKYMPVGSSAASVAIENLVYGLATTLFISAGAALMVLEIAAPERYRAVAGGTAILLLLSILAVAFVIGRRKLRLAAVLDWLKSHAARWPLVERYERGLRDFETDIHDFFHTRRRVFLFVLMLEVLASLTGIGEVYVILKATTGHASVLAAFWVEAANRVAHLVFFVPLGLGTEEGAAGGILSALGYSLSEGVSLAVIRKGRTIFWTLIGLLLAARWSISGSKAQTIREGSCRSHEAIDCQRG
jgi:uncharacterized protein (TIRG00374 family)